MVGGRRTDFVRASRTPAQVAQLDYDDVPNLVSMGVMRAIVTTTVAIVASRRAVWLAFAADPPGRW